jgi:Domain of unknown function (DUF4337)
MSKKKEPLKERVTSFIASLTDESAPPSPKDAPWIKHVALLTGVLAAFSGFLTVRTTSLTNDAIYQSDQAILAQAQASDAWAEYQADSIKARIIETQLVSSSPLSASDKAALSKADDEIRARQPQSKQTATDKSQTRDRHLEAGHKRLGEKDTLGYSSLGAQLGIALASVAAMTRKRIAFQYALLIGVASLLVTGYAFFEHTTF